MTTFMPELLWQDGLLLRPHHLQGLQRHCHSLLSHAATVRPFAYGVRRLALRESAVPDFVLDLTACDVVMPDGTPVIVGENAVCPPLEFRHLAQDSPVLDVFLGVAFLQGAHANVAPAGNGTLTDTPRRYLQSQVQLRDENTGGNPREVDTRLLQVRLFVGNRPPQGFLTLKLAELRKILDEGQPGGRYELSPSYVPPCTSVGAAPTLQRIVRELGDKLEEKHGVLLGHLRGRRDLLRGESQERLDSMLQLQATNGVLPLLRQLVAQPCLHPFDVYLHLTRLVGDLGLFSPDWAPPTLVVYDHDDPACAFDDLRAKWIRLLDGAVTTNVRKVPFAPADAPHGGLATALPTEFLAPAAQLFLGLETDVDIVDVERMFTEGRTVLAAPDEVQGIRRARIDGVPCDRSRTHPALRDRAGMVFLAVDRNDDLFATAKRARRLSLLGDAAQDPRVRAIWLYATDVVDDQEAVR